MASITILILLTTVALPLARVQIQRTKEIELKRDLREMREAIDHYKDFADRGMIPVKADTFGYPPDLKTLVEGVELKGSITAKYKFLRKLPVDPMTESDEWGCAPCKTIPTPGVGAARTSLMFIPRAMGSVWTGRNTVTGRCGSERAERLVGGADHSDRETNFETEISNSKSEISNLKLPTLLRETSGFRW